MLRRTLVILSPALFQIRPDPQEKEPDGRLPNGKNQRDEILKSEHAKSLEEAGEMIRLAGELKADLDKAGSFVVPVQTIRKTEEIERLAKRIRGRLKHG